MSYNHAISSDDPQALEKLNAKLESCQKLQDHMKAVNAYYRKHGTVVGCPNVSNEQAQKLDARAKNHYSGAALPYLPYELSGNTAEMRRIKGRIAQITKDKEVGFVGWKFPGGEAVTNTDINRLQLIFEEKPSEEQRTVLKRNGFHWSPKENAWQRQLNSNAIWTAGTIDFLRTVDGENPARIQPKAPQKDRER